MKHSNYTAHRIVAVPEIEAFLGNLLQVEMEESEVAITVNLYGRKI